MCECVCISIMHQYVHEGVFVESMNSQAYKCVHAYTRVYLCGHSSMCLCMTVCICVCMFVYMHVDMYVCMYVCMYACNTMYIMSTNIILHNLYYTIDQCIYVQMCSCTDSRYDTNNCYRCDVL